MSWELPLKNLLREPGWPGTSFLGLGRALRTLGEQHRRGTMLWRATEMIHVTSVI